MLIPELDIILLSAKINPTIKDIDALNKIIPNLKNWDYFVNILIERGLSPLFYNKIEILDNTNQIPKHIIAKLRKAYYKTLTRSLLLHDYFKNVTTAFNNNNLAFIALKGIYLSEWLYKDVGLRQFSDIDILVKPQDAQKALAILNELGYRSYDGIESEEIGGQKDLMHYKPRLLNDVSVEIHIKIHHSKENYLMPIDEIWQNAVKTKIDGINSHVLEFYDMFIHLCLHLDKHVKIGHVQFTSFADITNILSVYENEFDWNKLLEKTIKYNCEAIVFKFVILVNKYFNAPVPKNIVDKYAHLLKASDKKLFINYLKGISPFKSTLPCHFENIKDFKEIKKALKYLLVELFPPKSFMIDKYSIKYSVIYFFYYPYRWWIGFKGLVQLVIKSKR